MRQVLGRVYAVVYFARTLGRVRGRSFILRSPSRLQIYRGNRLTIGRNVMIDKDARIILRGGNITIGDDVFIGKNATLIAFSNLEIGPRALIGQNCSIHTENHGGPGERNTYTSFPVAIEEDVWLGAGVVVTAGRRVGKGVTVGANSVVTRDLPAGAGAIYVGAPARQVRRSNE